MLMYLDKVVEDPQTIIFVLCAALVAFIMTCIAIIDVGLKDFGGIGKKALWGFIAFIPFIGFIIYFVIGRRKGVKITNDNR